MATARFELATSALQADPEHPDREKAAFLLAGIERGEIKPYGAAKAMGYVKPPDPAAPYWLWPALVARMLEGQWTVASTPARVGGPVGWSVGGWEG